MHEPHSETIEQNHGLRNLGGILSWNRRRTTAPELENTTRIQRREQNYQDSSSEEVLSVDGTNSQAREFERTGSLARESVPENDIESGQ